jgi:uncharacterized coiled-coil protein SlyX
VNDDLDKDGRGLAYENGFRDGLKDARMDLQARIAVLEADRAEAVLTVETLKEQVAEVASVVREIEARTVEAVATWLDGLGDYEISKCAADVRAGAWRPE